MGTPLIFSDESGINKVMNGSALINNCESNGRMEDKGRINFDLLLEIFDFADVTCNIESLIAGKI